MTASPPAIACLGAGRMGRGIAVAFAYAGHAVTMIDVKPRSAEISRRSPPTRLAKSARRSQVWRSSDCSTEHDADSSHRADLRRARADMAAALAGAAIVFEGVPEVVELKREVLAAASKASRPT